MGKNSSEVFKEGLLFFLCFSGKWITTVHGMLSLKQIYQNFNLYIFMYIEFGGLYASTLITTNKVESEGACTQYTSFAKTIRFILSKKKIKCCVVINEININAFT